MADLGSVNNYFNQSDQNSIFRIDADIWEECAEKKLVVCFN